MFKGWAHIDLGQPDDGRELFLPLFTVLPYQECASHFYHILSIFYSIPYSIVSPLTQYKPTRSDQTQPGSTDPARPGPTRPDPARPTRSDPTTPRWNNSRRKPNSSERPTRPRYPILTAPSRDPTTPSPRVSIQQFSIYSTKWKQRILVNHCRGMQIIQEHAELNTV